MKPAQSAARIVVVCGSRNWPAPWFVTAKMIELIPGGSLVITGGAKNDLRDEHGRPLSVDQHAHIEAIRLGYQARVVEADWRPGGVYNPRAGFERNLKMLGMGAGLVLAFQFERSKGTGHTVREAYKRGIETHLFTETDLRPDIAALDGDWEPIGLLGGGA